MKHPENEDPRTQLQHTEPLELNSYNRPLTFPIYQSTKFEYDSFEHFLNPQAGDFFYSRVGNPSVRQLELMLAKLQGREDALAFTSGVAALTLPLLSLLKTGDHVIMFAQCYAPARTIVRDLLGKFGITHSMLFYDQLDELEKHITPATKIIHFESPTNPVVMVPDISKIVSVAKKHKVLTFMDNTLAGFHQHGEFEIDLFAHSLTKYASGHGDVMGGVIIGERALIQKIRSPNIVLGGNLDPHAAYLILRGMKTYFVRYETQCANAQSIAEYLSQHSKVTAVHYPGLERHPHHELAKKQMKHFGSVIGFDLHPSVKFEEFFDRLKYFKLAGSLGSTESLILPLRRLFGADLDALALERSWINERSVRISVGLESVADLKKDLDLALV